MSIPSHVRSRIKAELWKQADQIEWNALGSAEKSRYYSQWTESETIGRALSAHMDPRKVRVYIKDTLLKGYGREKLNEHQALVLRVTGHERSEVTEDFIKPHGFRCSDKSLVAWGRADDWKVLLGSLYERAHSTGGGASTAILFRAAPRFMGASSRGLVETAATRLGIERCVWFD
jgi:hypothetical protein